MGALVKKCNQSLSFVIDLEESYSYEHGSLISVTKSFPATKSLIKTHAMRTQKIYYPTYKQAIHYERGKADAAQKHISFPGHALEETVAGGKASLRDRGGAGEHERRQFA